MRFSGFLLLMGFLMLFFQKSHAQSIQWQRPLGGTSDETSGDIRVTPNGGSIIAGETNSSDGDVHGRDFRDDIWVVKLNAQGDTAWTRCLGGGEDDEGTSVQVTSNGNYVIAGETESDDGDVHGHFGLSDYWLVKLNSQGDTMWTKTLGGSAADEANSLELTKNGNYVLAGMSRSEDGHVNGNDSSRDAWIVKLDQNRDTLWSRSLGGSSIDKANAVHQTNDGGFIVAGETESDDGDVNNNAGGSDMWIIKLSNNGNIQWKNTYGSGKDDRASDIIQTNNGNFMVAGSAPFKRGTVAQADYWIVKLKNNGDTLWTQNYGGSVREYPSSIIQTMDGNFLIAGQTASDDGVVSDNYGSRDIWAIKIVSEGSLQWDQNFGGPGYDTDGIAREKGRGQYIFAGFTGSDSIDVEGTHGGSGTFWDIWAFEYNTPLAGIQQGKDSNPPFKVNPNPFTTQFKIQFKQNRDARIKITNLQGKRVYANNFQGESNQINLPSLNPGMYFLSVITEDGHHATRKIIKQ